MAAEAADGARRQRRRVRPWQALSDLNDRTSLRGKLITALLALVAVGLVAISVASVMVLRSYLISQDDPGLRQTYNYVSPDPSGAAVGSVSPLRGTIFVYGVQQQGIPFSMSSPGSGFQQVESVPSVPDTVIWADANSGKLLTVPAESGHDTWRVITQPISFTNASGATEQGTLVVGVDLGNINAVIGRLALAELVIGFIIVCILGAAAIAVVRANLRPLVEIEETAGEIAAGHLNRRVPERDPDTEIGRLGRSLNVMLSQIESAFHDREQSEEAARESTERMRRFIADASHELRTPLTAIRGFAEYYRQRGGLVPHWDRNEPAAAATTVSGLTPNELDRIMGRVEKEAARMGLLVEDLLLLARLDQQRPLAHQPVDLLSLAADAVHDARLLAPSRAVDLSVQPGAAFLVIGDEARLRQVIGNLMSNALTHTPDGTPIEVSISSGVIDPRASDPTPAVILDVTDHGPGMSREQARRVFERFYRADQARTRTTGGSGLGLAIVAALVAAQGGLASVRTTEGQGATFRISLPLAPEAQDGDDIDDADQPELADEPDTEAGPADEPDSEAGPADEPDSEAGPADEAGPRDGERGPEDQAESGDEPESGDEAELDGQRTGPSFRVLVLPVLTGGAVMAEQVAGLAVERLAEPGQGAEPDGPGVPVLQDGQVDHADANPLG
jgi:two-component system OmpR family sensor kinase